jgi:membrane protein
MPETAHEHGDSGDPEEAQSFGQRAMHVLDRLWKTISNAASGMGDHRGTQLAAGMAYYAVLSIFPAAIVIAAASGFILDDSSRRADAVEYLLRELPLSQDSGRNDVESLLAGVAQNSTTLGIIGLIALLVSASALVGAVRNSLSLIFDEEIRRGFVRGKTFDVLLVLVLGLLFVLSFAASIAGHFELQFDGSVGNIVEGLINGIGNTFVPLLITVVLVTATFKVLPAVRRPLRDLWPGILFVTLGYEVLKRGFALYLDTFSNYSAVYGSLAAVVAFMIFVYLVAFVFLFGAEMSAVWPGVREGDYDGDPDEEGESVGEAILGFLKRLFTRNEVER